MDRTTTAATCWSVGHEPVQTPLFDMNGYPIIWVWACANCGARLYLPNLPEGGDAVERREPLWPER